MTESAFEIHELPWPLPAGVAEADPAQCLADDVRLAKRLRDLLQARRAESREAMRAVLLKLLEVEDALERILANAPDPSCPSEVQQWHSVRVTRKLLNEALRLQSVTPLDVVGKEADPVICEVDGYQVRPDLPDETVVREIIRGYRWGDALLRPAVVVISRRE